jgi:hypothetical protein
MGLEGREEGTVAQSVPMAAVANKAVYSALVAVETSSETMLSPSGES